MTWKNRPRWPVRAAVTASLVLALAACGPEYPNTTFAPLSELATNIDEIWDKLLFWGVLVFILVEAAMIYIIIRYRHRPDSPEPRQIHGHTTLEVVWTLIPAFVLFFIALPTVRTIFKTQGDAPAGALQIDVYGHQWWWQFDYPELGINTANEVYIPAGRTVSFNLQTPNVLHSFWVPRLAGKRDLVNNRVNRIWFTVHDSVVNQVFNGFCAEFCGLSHANMHFRVFVVSQEDFERWRAHQASGSFGAAPAPATGGAAAAQQPPDAAAGAAVGAAGQDTIPAGAGGYRFPAERIEELSFTIPKSRPSDMVQFTPGLIGDPARGQQTFSQSLCVGCHSMNPAPPQVMVGPNLTHIASRSTIGAGMFAMNAENLQLWLKNAPALKPGSKMPAMGRGIDNSQLMQPPGMLDDQQLADIAAWLLTLR